MACFRSKSPRLICLTLLLAPLAASQPPKDPDNSLRALAKAGDLTTVELILSQGGDPNVEPNVGPSPLWEAAHNDDAAMVSLFLQFRANHSHPDPATLTTPLHVAVHKNSEQVVRLLLAYGANPEIAERGGLTALRAAASSEERVQTLFRIWERHGPIGLEDPPGTWHLFDDKDNGVPFYFNPITQEARWMKPPSCAWKRMEVGGQPIYVNEVTHQNAWVMPPSLSWKKVDIPGTTPFWLNFKNNVTNPNVPAELPEDLAQELSSNPRQYWFNVVSGDSQWNDPNENSWNELTDDTGRKYWFNPSSGDSTYEQPSETAWREIASEEHARTFYYNDITSEATWIKPAQLGWIQHDEL